MAAADAVAVGVSAVEARWERIPASIQRRLHDLIPAMRLTAEVLKEPAFPEADFDQIRQQDDRRCRTDGRTEPTSLSFEALQRGLGYRSAKGDVRHVRTIDEQIEDLKKVTLSRREESSMSSTTALRTPRSGRGGPLPAGGSAEGRAELFGNWKSSVSYTRIAVEVS